MATQAVVIFANDSVTQLGTVGERPSQLRMLDVPAPADPSPKAQAAAIKQAMLQAQLKSASAILALPSEWCLTASASTEAIRHRRRRALVYRLEAKLPIAAEELTADFLEGKGEALGVCAQTARLAPLLQELEEVGVRVLSVCPAALMALQHAISNGHLASYELAIWGYAEQLEVFALSAGKPTAWHHLSGERDALLRVLKLYVLRRGDQHVALVNVPTEQSDAIRCVPDLHAGEVTIAPLPVAATQMGLSVVLGQQIPWIELKRDTLGVSDPLRPIRQPLYAALASLVMFVLSVFLVLLYRAHHYQAIAETLRSRQRTAFQNVLPAQPVPSAGVRLRLASEERRLRGLRGTDAQLPLEESALEILYETLHRLPTDTRVRILELRIGGKELYVEGQARSHSDAEAVASALRGARFAIDPPRTEQLSGSGVGFSLSGTFAPQPAISTRLTP